MKKLMLVSVLVMALGQSGCAFLGGAAVGAVGTSAAYEINAHSQMSKLEDDYKAERISRREYDSRKSQIEKGSIIY
jgi:osmotically-inducible protein OsmY